MGLAEDFPGHHLHCDIDVTQDGVARHASLTLAFDPARALTLGQVMEAATPLLDLARLVGPGDEARFTFR